MMADSPVTFPQTGALPAIYPPDRPSTERETPEEGYYIFTTPERSLEQIATIQGAMPAGTFTPPPGDWGPLALARATLTGGGELHILALGDSIVNDTMRSGWVAKLQEAYPKASIRATVYVRGGGGCQHYREEGRVQAHIVPRKPDLVFIGGISQQDIESIREVIHQLRADLPDVEFLLATGTFGQADPRDPEALAAARHSGTGAYGEALRELAEAEGCAYLDMTEPWAEYIRSSNVHPHRFYRDVVHANEFGEQILCKILTAFWQSPGAETPARSADVEARLVIARNGSARYDIVIPEDATPAVRYAAQELQSLLREMSGARLPIVDEPDSDGGPALYIGPCHRTREVLPRRELRLLEEDGVAIRTEGDDVVLTGSNERGQLYSVYELLERFLGVRFLARDCTVVPKRATIALPTIDHRHSPPFMYRETLYFDSFPREIAARQRLNGPTTECDETTGGKIAFHPYVHSFSTLVPPAEFFDEHPDYFSLVDGKRTSATVHGQLCLTNPDVLRIATERVLQWLDEYPEVPILDVSQNDGNGACECADCMAIVEAEGSQHGPILRFVNAIADEVAKKDPDRWVETLAYAYAVKPPAITRPRANVITRLCHAGCYFHGFERCGLGSNLAGNLREWSELTDRIFIWHYATNFAHYLAPNPNLTGLALDIRAYADSGVNGLMVQGDYQSPGGDLAELRQYLAAQLMWDPTRDPSAIRTEFCRGYYGAAADRVLTYLARLDDEAERPDVHAFGAWSPDTTVSPALVTEGLEILDRARAAADTPEIRDRVARLMLGLRYMQLTYPERYGLEPTDAPGIVAEARRLVEEHRITHVREGGESGAAWIGELEARYGDGPK